jgi:2-methylcitrate dehydratase PrpD
LQSSDIEQIECTLAPWAAAIVCEPPEAKLCFDTELEATSSLPYQISVAVLDRRVSLEALHESSRKRLDISDFSSRVVYRKDDALGRRFEGIVKVRCFSGQSHDRRATLAQSDDVKVREKFVDLARPIIGEEQADAAASALLRAFQDTWRVAIDILRSVPVSCV